MGVVGRSNVGAELREKPASKGGIGKVRQAERFRGTELSLATNFVSICCGENLL
jgi:hypothetical protein